jgi:ribulose-phosphate 3-epimerase
MVKISVSILSESDDETILKLNDTTANYLHVDVMDGDFVDVKHFSISEINNLTNCTNKKLDIHLMVENPFLYIDQLKFSAIDYITFHYEISNDINSVIEKIKNRGIKCGIAVKPNTDIKSIFYLLDQIDLVLIMSVEPGYGGQSFMTSSLDKVKLLKEEIEKRKINVIISIDGGINNTNAKSCIEAGCDMLVSGSYIISQNNFQAAIDAMK